MIERIQTPRAPLPAGHYSQAIKANGFIFVAGQLPFAPGPERRMPEGIEAQARQCLENLAAILEAAGSSVDRLTSVQLFIPDVALWGKVNAVYEAFMGEARPARTVVPTRDLHYGALIELNAVAVAD
ncbi:RidA family protein [Achromobacter aloeverae]